ALAALSGSPLALAVTLALFGVTMGGLDVSMNANAVSAISRARRPWMPGFHGLWSLGGMGGAAAGGLAAGAGLGILPHFLLAGAAGLVLAALAGRRLAPDPPAAHPVTATALPAALDPAAVGIAGN